MHIEIARTFTGTADEVHAALVDPETQAAKARAVSALEHEMSVREVDGRLEVVCRRRVPSAGLPEFVRSMVRPSMTIVETERWEAPRPDGARDAEFLLDIEGAPVRLRGFAHLVAVDGDCTLTWCGDLEATVPFFRSKITEASSAAVLETIEIEFDLLERRLRNDAEHTTTP